MWQRSSRCVWAAKADNVLVAVVVLQSGDTWARLATLARLHVCQWRSPLSNKTNVCVYVDTPAVQTVVFQFRLVGIDVWLPGSLHLLQELCFRVLCVDFKNCVAGFSAFTSRIMFQGSLR